MTNAHKNALRAALSAVCSCMEPRAILTYLESKFVLTRDDVDEIKMNGFATNRKQIESLMHLLMTKSDTAFDHLINALKDAEQCHVANVILREYQGLVSNSIHCKYRYFTRENRQYQTESSKIMVELMCYFCLYYNISSLQVLAGRPETLLVDLSRHRETLLVDPSQVLS